MAKSKQAKADKAKVEALVLKAGPSFRLKKEYKTLIALEVDAHRRGELRRSLIAAQLAETHAGMTNRKGFLEMFKGAV